MEQSILSAQLQQAQLSATQVGTATQSGAGSTGGVGNSGLSSTGNAGLSSMHGGSGQPSPRNEVKGVKVDQGLISKVGVNSEIEKEVPSFSSR